MATRKRRNFKRNNQRLVADLQSRCYICYDRRPRGEGGRDFAREASGRELDSEERSAPLPCCNKYVHESCLAKCFYHAPHNKNCPFCREVLTPLNVNEAVPAGCRGTIMRFSQVTFQHGRDDNTSFHQRFYNEHDFLPPPPQAYEGEMPYITPNLRLLPPGYRGRGFDDSPPVRMEPPMGWSETMQAALSGGAPHPPSSMSNRFLSG